MGGAADDIPQSQALNGIKALSKMSSLTIRNAKLEVVEVSKYFVKEDKKQNTITVYSKFQDTETMKIVKESKKNLKVYDHDNQCFGEVKISMTQCCNYGVAKEVEIQDKNGMLLC